MHSDVQIAGDPLALVHLLAPVPDHPSTVSGFVGLVRSLASDRRQWAPLVRYDATSRWYHRLRLGPGYEVWLLSWLPGQGTGPHDHGGSAGVFTVLDGALTERRATSPGTRQSLRPGTVRVLAPGCRHEVVNGALEPAVSLHLYAPGLRTMTVHPPAGHGATAGPAPGPERIAEPAGEAPLCHALGSPRRAVAG